jgi:hypothetical protein
MFPGYSPFGYPPYGSSCMPPPPPAYGGHQASPYYNPNYPQPSQNRQWRRNGPSHGPSKNGPRPNGPGRNLKWNRNQKPYERNPGPKSKPAPAPLKQLTMPFFFDTEGKAAQLCVSTAKGELCKNQGCSFSHAAKEERPCMQYHSRAARCPHGYQCLLGHKEAKEAWGVSRTAQRTTGQQMEIGGHGTAKTAGGLTKMNVDQTKAPNQNPPVGASSPTVDFEQLAQQNAAIGLNDQMRRLQETVATLRI